MLRLLITYDRIYLHNRTSFHYTDTDIGNNVYFSTSFTSFQGSYRQNTVFQDFLGLADHNPGFFRTQKCVFKACKVSKQGSEVVPQKI